MRRSVTEELRSTFRPEFLNRVDETIIFRRLSGKDMLAITRTVLRPVTERFQALGLALDVPEETVQWLAHKGYDDRFGARPLRRTVQQSIEDAAADMLLDGSLRPGDRVTAKAENDRIVLQKS